MKNQKATAADKAAVSATPLEETGIYGARGGDEYEALTHVPTHSMTAAAGTARNGQRHAGLGAMAQASNPAAAALRRMLNRSGNSLFVAIEPLTAEEFFAGGVNGISVAWTVGHLACVFDLFTSWIHGGDCHFSKDIHGTFNSLEIRAPGGPSKAEVVRNAGHSKPEIQHLLRVAQVNALKLLDTCSLADWDAAPAKHHPDNLHTIGEIWEHLAIHTYWHMGELCGTFPRFHGTYTLNMLPHYFFYLPPENDLA
jgi:hypothetical protein